MVQDVSVARTTDPHHPERPDEPGATAAGAPRTAAPSAAVTLDRLLRVVVLSPAQAVLVAARLLDAIHLRDATTATDADDGHLWVAALTPSGGVEVTRTSTSEGTGAGELLELLSRHARRLPAHPSPEQLLLLRRLEEATTDRRLDPGARARVLEGALVEVLGSGAGQRLTGELAALVEAFAHTAPGIAVSDRAPATRAGTLPAPHPHRAAPMRSRPSQPPWRRLSRAPGRRRVRVRRTALVVLLLLAATAGSGYVVLRDPDGGAPGVVDRSRTPAAPSTTAPPGSSRERSRPQSRDRTGVAALAPRQAAAITGVEVQKVGACTPGALCPVTVTARLLPDSTARPVTWRVGTAQSCTGKVVWSPPVTVTAQPGWTTVYASSSVPVPEGRSLALVALTTAPARAQSPPVPAAGSTLRC